jgi:HlyD family secretion protein
VPKVSLTGQSTERTDTRVLQAIYSFDPAALPVYVGQQMDVFIEAPSATAPSQRTSENRPCLLGYGDPRCSAWP